MYTFGAKDFLNTQINDKLSTYSHRKFSLHGFFFNFVKKDLLKKK